MVQGPNRYVDPSSFKTQHSVIVKKFPADILNDETVSLVEASNEEMTSSEEDDVDDQVLDYGYDMGEVVRRLLVSMFSCF